MSTEIDSRTRIPLCRVPQSHVSPPQQTRTRFTVLLRASVCLRQGIGGPGLALLTLVDHQKRLAVPQEIVPDAESGDLRGPETRDEQVVEQGPGPDRSYVALGGSRTTPRVSKY